MKYISKYNEEFDWKKLNPFRKLNDKEKVQKWLDSMYIKKYTIKGFPIIIEGSSDFSYNKINSFIGFPEKIGSDSIYGYYDNVKKIYCESNPIKELIDCIEGPFDICKMINYLNEYDVISGKNIFLDKYKECLELMGVPDDEIFLYEDEILDIKGYKIIE